MTPPLSCNFSLRWEVSSIVTFFWASTFKIKENTSTYFWIFSHINQDKQKIWECLARSTQTAQTTYHLKIQVETHKENFIISVSNRYFRNFLSVRSGGAVHEWLGSITAEDPERSNEIGGSKQTDQTGLARLYPVTVLPNSQPPRC